MRDRGTKNGFQRGANRPPHATGGLGRADMTVVSKNPRPRKPVVTEPDPADPLYRLRVWEFEHGGIQNGETS